MFRCHLYTELFWFPCDFTDILHFIGASVKSRKATVSFVMFVRLSVRMEQFSSHWTDFHGFFSGMRIFLKSVEKIQVWLNSDKYNGYITWGPIYIFWSYLVHFFLERKMYQTQAAEKIEAHILCSKTLFFFKSCRLWVNVEKYCIAWLATETIWLMRI
jgi:hypothetical protein